MARILLGSLGFPALMVQTIGIRRVRIVALCLAAMQCKRLINVNIQLKPLLLLFSSPDNGLETSDSDLAMEHKTE